MRRWLFWLALAAAVLVLCSDAAGASPALQVTAELSTRNVRAEESNLADLITDALRAVEKADVALMTASAFNEVSIPRGEARADDIVAALANRDDTVVMVHVTGAQLRRALERALALLPQRNIAFMQVSGITVTADPEADKDKRVVSVRVGKVSLDPARSYTVAMPAPLANGALLYGTIWSRADIDHDTGKTLAQAVTDYLAPLKSVGAKSEERLIVRK